MAQTSLPPGFRFHPTDVELVSYYLKRKIMGKKLFVEAIPVVELYKYAPWDLPDKSCLRSRDLEWYFFCPRDKKYTKGSRTNRATPNGYWKTTGKDRTIVLNSRIVGMKKTLIFHEGKVPKGDRTDWVMYEYKMEDNELEVADFTKDAYVLCKIFKKSGLGPKIGEQYGAPFNEEEWDDANAEAAMFPLMACPSSELADAVDESPVQHTVAASVVDEPPVLTAAAEGLPFEYNSTSTTAFDELQSYHTLESRGSEMASANNASDALIACNPPEFGGIVSNEWAGFLNDSPDCDGANEQLTELPAMPEAEAHALEINSDYLYNELARLLESEGVPTVHDQCPGYVNTEYFNPPMTSELGTGDNYLELNDLFPLGQTISSEMLVPHNLFPQYFSDQFPYNQLNYPHYENDGALAASLAAGNLLPSIPSMHDMSVHDTTFTTNLMGNNGSNPTSCNARRIFYYYPVCHSNLTDRSSEVLNEFSCKLSLLQSGYGTLLSNFTRVKNSCPLHGEAVEISYCFPELVPNQVFIWQAPVTAEDPSASDGFNPLLCLSLYL